MEMVIRKKEQASILKISGDVNIRTAPRLHDQTRKMTAAAPKRIIVDLEEVEYMDSSGVGVLVTSMKHANQANIPFGLAHVNERVHSILKLTRLTSIFQIFPDVASAIEGLQSVEGA